LCAINRRGALLALSAGLWFSAYKSVRDLETTITTIALPDRFAMRLYRKAAVFFSCFISGVAFSAARAAGTDVRGLLRGNEYRYTILFIKNKKGPHPMK